MNQKEVISATKCVGGIYNPSSEDDVGCRMLRAQTIDS